MQSDTAWDDFSLFLNNVNVPRREKTLNNTQHLTSVSFYIFKPSFFFLNKAFSCCMTASGATQEVATTPVFYKSLCRMWSGHRPRSVPV